jgi:ABC-type transporter Mla subunit MlaD
VLLTALDETLREFSDKTVPVLENLEAITSRLKAISENVEDQVTAVRDSFSAIRSVADNVLDLERQIQDRVEGPILETLAFVAAVVKGLRTFFARVRE